MRSNIPLILLAIPESFRSKSFLMASRRITIVPLTKLTTEAVSAREFLVALSRLDAGEFFRRSSFMSSLAIFSSPERQG